MSRKVCSFLTACIMIIGMMPIISNAAPASRVDIRLEATSYETDGVIVPYYETDIDETASYYRWLVADSADAPESEWKEIVYDNTSLKTSGYVTAETSYEAYLLLTQNLAGKYVRFELTPSDDVNFYDKVLSDPTPMIEFTPNLLNNGSFDTAGINPKTGEVYGWSDGTYDPTRKALKTAGAELGDHWYNRFDFPMALTAGNYKFTDTATYQSGAGKNFRANYCGLDMGNGNWTAGRQFNWATGSFTYSLTASDAPYIMWRICTGTGAGAEIFWMKDLSLAKIGPYAKNAAIEGEMRVGSTVTASYNYISEYDAAGMTKGDTVITWLWSDNSYGPFTEFAQGDAVTLETDLESKYIKIKVTPKNSAGTEGTAITSAPVKVLAEPDEYSIERDGNVKVTYKNNRAKDGFPMYIFFTEYSFENGITSFENIEVVEDYVLPGEENKSINTYTPESADNTVKVELFEGEYFNERTFMDSQTFGAVVEADVPQTSFPGGIDIDYQNGIIRLYGAVDEDIDVTDIKVYKPGTDYKGLRADEFESSIEFYRSDLPVSDGKYNVAFRLNDTDIVNREFIVTVSGKDDVIKFKYFNSDTIEHVLDVMSGATAEDLCNMFGGTLLVDGEINVNEIFKVDLTDFNALDGKYQLNVMNELKTYTFSSDNIAAIGTVIEDEIEKQCKVKALDDAILYVTSGEVSAMGARIAEKNDILGLDLTNAYGYALTDNTGFLNMIHKSLSGITDSEQFYNQFDKAVAGAAAKYSDWGNILKIIESNNDIYGVDLTTKYNSLTKTERTELSKRLIKKGLNDASTIDAAIAIMHDNFGRLVTDIINARNEGNSGGSSDVGNYIAPPSQTDTLKPITDTDNENTEPVEIPKFADIENVAWAKEAIESLTDQGILKGTGDGYFEPNRNITRAEFLTMVVGAMEISYPSDTKYFADVNKSDWYYDSVTTAAVAGIVTGDEHGRFNPNQNITRQDMAVILHRAMVYCNKEIKQKNEVNIFADTYSISMYALASVTKLQSAGIINGMDNNKFEPNLNATRAMAAKMIYTAINNQ